LAILNKYNADGHLTRDITYLRQTFHIWLYQCMSIQIIAI
jgi:hypothetical protein